MTRRQTILITGATDGLGRALAHRLAADGATLRASAPARIVNVASIGQEAIAEADLQLKG